jgi:hypothetical protein
MRLTAGLFSPLLLVLPGLAADKATTPNPVPLTRPEMKQSLEDLKGRKPRIPLPELTDEEKEKLGERGRSYEGRLRFHYMPGGEGRGGFGGMREQDPAMTLDYKFKTTLFWLVSRTNNCHY